MKDFHISSSNRNWYANVLLDTKIVIHIYFLYFSQVLFDFSNHYPDECNTFKNNWNKFKSSIQNVLKTRESTKNFATEYSCEVKLFLMLLKMFPARFNGRKSAVRLSFKQAVEKFIVFREVSKLTVCLFLLYYSLIFIIYL